MKIQTAIYFKPTIQEAREVLAILSEYPCMKGEICVSSSGGFTYEGKQTSHIKKDYKELFSVAYLSHKNRIAVDEHWKGLKQHEQGFNEKYKAIFYYNVELYEDSVCSIQFEPYDICEEEHGIKQHLDIERNDPYFMRKFHDMYSMLQGLGWQPVAI